MPTSDWYGMIPILIVLNRDGTIKRERERTGEEGEEGKGRGGGERGLIYEEISAIIGSKLELERRQFQIQESERRRRQIG